MKIGLSLSGGGANGAFHLGAINALNDFGFGHFNYVAGVSAGAIVGSMANDPSRIRSFFCEVAGNPDKVMQSYFTNEEFNFSLGRTIKNLGKLINFQSLASSEGLAALINKYAIKHPNNYFGVGLVSLDNGKYHFCERIDFDFSEEFNKAILASASQVPIWEPVQEIRSKYDVFQMCIDGGFRVISPVIDCLRMTELYAKEKAIIFEINCRNNNPDKKLKKDNLLQYMIAADSIKSAQLFQTGDDSLVGVSYPNIFTIQPSDDIDLPSKLDFSEESMDYTAKLGYDITIKKLTEWEQLQRFN